MSSTIAGILLLVTYLAFIVYAMKGKNLMVGFFVLAIIWAAISGTSFKDILTYLAGRTVMSVEGQSEVCGPGWICVIPPDVPHEGTLVEPTLQVNFSSPARGAGYVEFLRNAFKTDQ